MNEQLQHELDYCCPLGIPHSTFLDWDSDDQDKAIAHMLERRKACPDCGTRAEEWEANPDAYVGHVRRCAGCEVVEQTNADLPTDRKLIRGVKVGLMWNDGGDE